MKKTAKWIHAPRGIGEVSPEFRKSVNISKKVIKAEALVSAFGVYDFFVNGKKISDAYMAPGWTSFEHRIQYQRYNITENISQNTTFSILAGKGWALGSIGYRRRARVETSEISVIARITLFFDDGTSEDIATDGTWQVYTSKILFSEIYDGETVDAGAEIKLFGYAELTDKRMPELIEQVGEFIIPHERISPSAYIVTPKGERVIDFGQNLAGFVKLNIKANKGERIVISCAEVLDRDGNFYNDNYHNDGNTDDLNIMTYVCSGGEDVFAPRFSFQGFRYIRLDEYPYDTVDLNCFEAVAVYSDMKRTGHFSCGHAGLNQLYSNTLWSHRSNFIDIPTDCPQRGERLGWTGDAGVFCRTAAINYDVKRFFRKWLGDMALEQLESGALYSIVPMVTDCARKISSAWADAACVCPWEIYLAYGDTEMLRENYPMMQKWVEYMHGAGDEECLWLGGDHYGDWLATDAGYGSYIGATQADFIASAYFAYSCELVVKAGKVIGEDTAYFEKLYENVRKRFRECFMKNGLPAYYGSGIDNMTYHGKTINIDKSGVTQTAIALILRFGLYEENEKEILADKLAELIRENGGRMSTGFVGTPHILHALSIAGKDELAFDLLLQEKNPSWLYSVNRGATTIWEHWDGINEAGEMWSHDMNSFNHYAYGSVFDWIYGVMLGIKVSDDGAGYTKIELSPITDKRIGYASGSIDTRQGRVSSSWRYIGDKVRYEFEIPQATTATLKLDGKERILSGGHYTVII